MVKIPKERAAPGSPPEIAQVRRLRRCSPSVCFIVASVRAVGCPPRCFSCAVWHFLTLISDP